jgi:hypothetical protein
MKLNVSNFYIMFTFSELQFIEDFENDRFNRIIIYKR